MMGFYGSTSRPAGAVSIRVGIDNAMAAEVKVWASQFTTSIQNRLLKHGAIAAAIALVAVVRPYIPRSSGKNETAGKGHIQDALTYKVKGYTSNKRKVVFIGVGYSNKDKVANLQHLIEFGNWRTRPRLTNHKTIYHKRGLFAKQTKMKTTKRKDGSIYQRQVPINRNNKFSLGSFEKDASKASISRGNFPRSGIPYAPLQRGLTAAGDTLRSIINEDVKAGLTRITKRSALAAARSL